MEQEWEISEAEIDQFMKEAIRLVKECGEIIAEAIRSQTNVEIQQKEAVASEGHGSAVLTETDMKVEQHLIQGLRASFPDFFHFGIHCWDMAAGALIVSEAGGVVLDPSGGEFDLMSRDILVCSSSQLAHQILSFLKIYRTERDLTEKYKYF